MARTKDRLRYVMKISRGSWYGPLTLTQVALEMAKKVWSEPAASVWLESPNSYLEGARPIDVLLMGKSDDFKNALESEK